MRIEADGPGNARWSVEIDRIPDLCPVCKKHCTPELVQAFGNDSSPGSRVMAVYRCPNSKCLVPFTAVYIISGVGARSVTCRFQRAGLFQPTETRQFSQNIETVSPDFCEIYRQAEDAEANGLRMICGVGYRKSLEFLIKDFLFCHVLKDRPDDQEKVRSLFLGDCIKVYVEDARIKAVAERAVWLGNDETHYVRSWPDKDLGDLKRLVNMTVNWIDLMMDSEKYVEEMVPGKRSEEKSGA